MLLAKRIVNIHQLIKSTVFVTCPTKKASVEQDGSRAQGRSPDTPGIPQNASSPVVISLKRGASGARR